MQRDERKVDQMSIDEGEGEISRLPEIRTFRRFAADHLADEVDVLVRTRVIDARSPAADALLDYREPPATPRSDRISDLERQVASLRHQVEAMRAVHDQARQLAEEVAWLDQGRAIGDTDIERQVRSIAATIRDGRRPHPELGLPGFVRIGRIDAVGRRSLWMRITEPENSDALRDDDGRKLRHERGVIELRAGREGGDAQVTIPMDSPLSRDLYDVLSTARYAAEWEDPTGFALEVDDYGGANLIAVADTGIDLLRALDADPTAGLRPPFAPIDPGDPGDPGSDPAPGPPMLDQWPAHVSAIRHLQSWRASRGLPRET